MMLQKALHEKKLAILLCSYNGGRFLGEQLESFVAQTYSNWQLLVSDDRSSDSTESILKTYQEKWPQDKLEIIQGPGQGFVENFKSITQAADGRADYYAWSDQDDIWLPDKLERAVSWLNGIAPEVPALYCGRTLLVTEDNRELSPSMLFSKQPSFANALMQNIGGGNTMIFNQAACQLLVETLQNTQVASHDWWAYIIVTAVGGQVHYDSQPCLRYRQHATNLVGGNLGWRARLSRCEQLFKNRFKYWNGLHIHALQQHQQQLTAENRAILQQLINIRQQPMLRRLICLQRSGLYRQTLLGNLGLVVAALFGKL